MEKSKFFVFLFAMVPGMSHMYLGMLKKGVFLMSLFLAPIALIFLTRGGLEIVSCILPVVWCYSFFDVFRYKSYSKEERYHLDAEFYKKLKLFWEQDAEAIFFKRRKLIGLFCIFLAVYTFIYNILGYFTNVFGRIFWSCYIMLSKVPTLLVVIFLLKLGIDLLRAEDDDFVAYHKKQKKVKNSIKEDIEEEFVEKEFNTKEFIEKQDIEKEVIEKEDIEKENIEKQDIEKNNINEYETINDTEKEEIKQNEEYQDIILENGEKIVEPIFLEKRIEE